MSPDTPDTQPDQPDQPDQPVQPAQTTQRREGRAEDAAKIAAALAAPDPLDAAQAEGRPVPASKAAKLRKDRIQGGHSATAPQNTVSLAQIVNLHIAGYSLEDIGAATGQTADEVDRVLQRDAARYVRTQPALRTYVRNWVSDRYTKLLEAVWDDATDAFSATKLEHQDRAIKILDRMAKLHGADAPVQTEVKVDAAPEAVEQLVQALASQQGMGYDVEIFDVVEAEVVHAAVEQSHTALQEAHDAVETAPEPDDTDVTDVTDVTDDTDDTDPEWDF